MNKFPFKIESEALSACCRMFAQQLPSQSEAFAEILSIAEKLSAGESAGLGPNQKAKQAARVVTIFDRIGAGRKKSSADRFLPLESLSASEAAVFPSEVTSSGRGEVGSSAITGAFQRSDLDDDETYLEKILSALRQHAWGVPSEYHAWPADVSLYDHARIMAAIAACLTEVDPAKLKEIDAALAQGFHAPGKLTETQEQLLSEPVGLLIGGDISGIQRFICTISGDGAARALRGRSFYLQVLTEVLVRSILNELNLSYCSVIYAGGGNFYLLAPLSAAEKLPSIRTRIARKLLRHHGIELYLSLGSAAIPFSGFRKGAFPTYWNRMHQDLGVRKQQRYRELGAEMHPLVFQPQPHGGNQEKVCAVCGEEKADAKRVADTGERICRSCESFGDVLGRRLPETGFIRFTFGDPVEGEPGSFEDTLAEFGVGFELFSKTGKPLGEAAVQIPNPRRSVVWEIDDPDSSWRAPASPLPTVRWRHYVAAEVPYATFDEMQDAIVEGTKRLGVLRMDVDNLGEVFQTGFGKGTESIATISRISALSFQLSLFFEGYLKRLCEKYSHIYTVYSGGDDLFLVGPWQEALELAFEVHRQFTRYTHENPLLHISGGMSFIHGKYPIAQAADDAHDAEEMAKSVEGKNAFAFLDEAFRWDDFAKVAEKKALLVSNRDLPSALLQTLQQLDSQREVSGRKQFGRWIWMGEYQLFRMEERLKGNRAAAEVIRKVRTQLRESYYSDLHQWAKAARWAQLAIRRD